MDFMEFLPWLLVVGLSVGGGLLGAWLLRPTNVSHISDDAWLLDYEWKAFDNQNPQVRLESSRGRKSLRRIAKAVADERALPDVALPGNPTCQLREGDVPLVYDCLLRLVFASSGDLLRAVDAAPPIPGIPDGLAPVSALCDKDNEVGGAGSLLAQVAYLAEQATDTANQTDPDRQALWALIVSRLDLGH